MRPLRALRYGDLDAGVCDTDRFGAIARSLDAHDVELRPWDGLAPFDPLVPTPPVNDLDRAIAERRVTIDLAPLRRRTGYPHDRGEAQWGQE